MAKININFDTKDKTIGCEMDGKPVDNVHEVAIYKGYDSEGFSMRISQMMKDDENDMKYVQHIMAKNSNEGYLQSEINCKSISEDLFVQKPMELVVIDEIFKNANPDLL